MDLDQRLAISYYKPIAAINEPHHVYLVQHQETKKIAIKKVLNVYNLAVYAELYRNPIAGTPRIINYYEEAGQLTVIEEYISGTSLQDKISHADIAPSDMLQYMLDLCAILEQLHQHNPAIIHRDVKPSNVIITSYNRAVLLDFNAAKYHTAAKDSDTILLGTQGYAAPEQYGFGQSSPQTDIYSIGILLKEMAEASHCQNPYIDAVTAKCTQMNPAERYRSIGELRQAFLANRGVFPYTHADQAFTGDLSGSSSKCSNTERSRYLRKPYAICPSRFPFQNTLEDGGCTAYLYISGMVLLIHESKQYLRSGTVGGTCICTRYDAFYRSFDLRLSPCTTAYASVPTRKKIAAHIWCGCVRHPRCIRIDRRHGDRAIVLSEFITCRI